MIASDIWNKLVLTLQQNPTISAYNKYVYEGKRFDFDAIDYPCIMLEPTQNNEVEKDLNTIKDIYLNVDVYAFSSANYHEFPKTIVGGQDYKGILDIENDIRACLQSSYDLGGTALDIRFDPTVFDQLEGAKYPVRGLLMPIKILYRQTNGA